MLGVALDSTSAAPVFAALLRYPARVVAGMFVAQISLFMFLVDHDQPQFVHRSEDGGTRAHHDPGLSRRMRRHSSYRWPSVRRL